MAGWEVDTGWEGRVDPAEPPGVDALGIAGLAGRGAEGRDAVCAMK